jgi:hypothetical protein
MIHFKSIDHQDFPVTKELVRANTIISGYLIETISENPAKSQIRIVSQTDIGGNIPKMLIQATSVKSPKDWVTNLIKGLEVLVKNNK